MTTEKSTPTDQSAPTPNQDKTTTKSEPYGEGLSDRALLQHGLTSLLAIVNKAAVVAQTLCGDTPKLSTEYMANRLHAQSDVQERIMDTLSKLDSRVIALDHRVTSAAIAFTGMEKRIAAIEATLKEERTNADPNETPK